MIDLSFATPCPCQHAPASFLNGTSHDRTDPHANVFDKEMHCAFGTFIGLQDACEDDPEHADVQILHFAFLSSKQVG